MRTYPVPHLVPRPLGDLTRPAPLDDEPGPKPLTGWRMAVAGLALAAFSVLALASVLGAFGQLLALYLF